MPIRVKEFNSEDELNKFLADEPAVTSIWTAYDTTSEEKGWKYTLLYQSEVQIAGIVPAIPPGGRMH